MDRDDDGMLPISGEMDSQLNIRTSSRLLMALDMARRSRGETRTQVVNRLLEKQLGVYLETVDRFVALENDRIAHDGKKTSPDKKGDDDEDKPKRGKKRGT